MNKGFIFDWSGTLADNFSGFCHVCELMFEELGNVLELVTEAWNYFPHKVLGGISPAKNLSEHRS